MKNDVLHPALRSNRPLVASIVFVAIASFAVFLLSSAVSAVNADPRDDAYHYMKNGIDDQLYNEWWYFNGRDEDTHFMLTFLLSDPDNLTAYRRIQIQAVLLQDGQLPILGSHQSRGFGGDRNSPMFDIDKNGFSSDQEGRIQVRGEVEDEATSELLRWDLIYEAAADPWYAIPTQTKVGQSGWMKWLVYMPLANVTGSFTIGNRTVNVDGTGYHDHIWGRFPLNDAQFTWAEASNPAENFSLIYREIWGNRTEDNPKAYLGIQKEGESIEFSGGQMKANYTDHSEYAIDNATLVHPARYSISADNGDWSLELSVGVFESIPTVLDYPRPMLDRLDLQQLALLQGTLRSKSGEEYVFEERGFSGYSVSGTF
ncbi:MAG: hypothetical protein M0Q47_03830 [Methanothrix sp.]|uniref:hypothetical protein n=1 Tax=Methanothrix sp. TaxID=90426 RepID=UPI0025E160F3|nr:hypothetical protein [Methanothrix sp.]MCK9405529.1 hypothetical protein [Methanothrix sp.]